MKICAYCQREIKSEEKYDVFRGHYYHSPECYNNAVEAYELDMLAE